MCINGAKRKMTAVCDRTDIKRGHISGRDTCPPQQTGAEQWAPWRVCCAARQSFNVVRIFGFPVQRGFNLQTSPGVYNEAAFVALDRVISEAGRAGLKLIIALTNNWNYNNVQTDWKCAHAGLPLCFQAWCLGRLQGPVLARRMQTDVSPHTACATARRQASCKKRWRAMYHANGETRTVK